MFDNHIRICDNEVDIYIFKIRGHKNIQTFAHHHHMYKQVILFLLQLINLIVEICIKKSPIPTLLSIVIIYTASYRYSISLRKINLLQKIFSSINFNMFIVEKATKYAIGFCINYQISNEIESPNDGFL
jgi:hypothetical protein